MLGEYAMEELISKLPLPGEAPAIPGPATIYALCGTFLQLIVHDSMNALRKVGSNHVKAPKMTSYDSSRISTQND